MRPTPRTFYPSSKPRSPSDSPCANGGLKTEAYVGWTGIASASSLVHFNSADAEKGCETIEIDPQYAMGSAAVVEIGILHDLPLAKSFGAERCPRTTGRSSIYTQTMLKTPSSAKCELRR
ncbi:hypothetical protein FIBSPDRAFT_176436 [Athelia psychrophila]|uniref:Uncharacterized protein n=1 Tax=Athelia psychrophila TaxID=1759441 RepID=A0A166AML9_9AGAM|nr:hypothetical protein FIBSPDRAFT_176436 [Fibularhizoctonia sp. CBS 109695]